MGDGRKIKLKHHNIAPQDSPAEGFRPKSPAATELPAVSIKASRKKKKRQWQLIDRQEAKVDQSDAQRHSGADECKVSNKQTNSAWEPSIHKASPRPCENTLREAR